MLTVKGESLPYIPCDWYRIYIRSMREGRRVEWDQLCGLRQPVKLERLLRKPEPDRTHKKPVISSKHGPVGSPVLWLFVITIGYLAANQQMISNTVVYTNSRETLLLFLSSLVDWIYHCVTVPAPVILQFERNCRF